MKISLKLKNFIFVPVFLVVLVSIFGLGFFFGREAVKQTTVGGIINQDNGKPSDLDFSLFWEVWHKLENKYVNKQKLDKSTMFYGAISGMVRSIGDPYTVFMPPDDSKKFMQDMTGTFDGIGAEIGIRKDMITVISPLKDSPAERAGLKSGDKIIKIDDKITSDMGLDEAISLIRGQKGTKVILTIARDGLLKTKEISIIRDRIVVPPLKLTFLDGGQKQSSKKKIAHIELYQFSDQSFSDFKKAAQEILKSQTSGIVLDLRNNPGGYLEISADIASLFLQKDQIVAIEEYSSGERKEYKARGNPLLIDFPLVVLINQGSASASEILAGALRDNRKVEIIGEKSFGKGSVQEFENLRDNTSLKITVAKWLTPSGQSIQDGGIEPDVKVEMTEDDYNNGKDPQLEKAIELLGQ